MFGKKNNNKKDVSVLAKRKLNFNYKGFIGTTSRPPLSSSSLSKLKN